MQFILVFYFSRLRMSPTTTGNRLSPRPSIAEVALSTAAFAWGSVNAMTLLVDVSVKVCFGQVVAESRHEG